jgi:hypothetical protein
MMATVPDTTPPLTTRGAAPCPRALLAAAAALALLLPACKSAPRLESCDDDPAYFTLVEISGDLGRLGACPIHREQFALALRLSLPEGAALAVGNDAWQADAAGIHWLDLKPWLLDLPTRVARRWAEAVEGPIGIPLTITEDGQPRRGELRLELGTVKWSDLLTSVASGYRFPRPAADAPASSLVYVPSAIDDPVYLGQAERLRDLRLVAVGASEVASTDTCGPYSPLEPSATLGFSVNRSVYSRTVTVYHAHTGEQAAQRRFVAELEPCPTFATEGDRLEARPAQADIVAWLEMVRQSQGDALAP